MSDDAKIVREVARQVIAEGNAEHIQRLKARVSELCSYAELLRVALSGARFGLMWIAHNEDKTLPEWAREIAKEKMEQADVALQRVKDSTQDGICAAHSPGSTTTRPDGGAISPEKTCQGEGRHPSPDFLHQSCTKSAEQLAAWMIANGFTTGHGDDAAALLQELTWQVKELRGRHQVGRDDGWIAMAEREPERSGEYLIWDGEDYEVGRWNDGDFYRLNGVEPPTHWMPLPPAPDSQSVACTKQDDTAAAAHWREVEKFAENGTALVSFHNGFVTISRSERG